MCWLRLCSRRQGIASRWPRECCSNKRGDRVCTQERFGRRCRSYQSMECVEGDAGWQSLLYRAASVQSTRALRTLSCGSRNSITPGQCRHTAVHGGGSAPRLYPDICLNTTRTSAAAECTFRLRWRPESIRLGEGRVRPGLRLLRDFRVL
eukprot:2989594-Prymnesium_polylepis.1